MNILLPYSSVEGLPLIPSAVPSWKTPHADLTIDRGSSLAVQSYPERNRMPVKNGEIIPSLMWMVVIVDTSSVASPVAPAQDAQLDRWLAAFDQLLSRLPRVSHRVSSSRDSIY